MSIIAADVKAIPGWGIDADPMNDPTYPIRDQSRDEHEGLHWNRPPQQVPDVEVLMSIEHERLPAVVGTSTPPSGLSGIIRRQAFKRSESDWWHWLMLMGADRIQVVEGVLGDLAQGRIPNIPAEMGIRSELAHNKAGFARKLAVTAVLSVALFAVVRGRRKPETEVETLPRP